jgi:hypothetical protein
LTDEEFRDHTILLVSECHARQDVLDAAVFGLLRTASLGHEARASVTHAIEEAYANAQATSANEIYFEAFERLRERLMVALMEGATRANANTPEPAAPAAAEASPPPA